MSKINNNIEERRVSFPVAKLLKEAGCDRIKIAYGLNQILNNDSKNTVTQQFAIDWIRVNFGIHIQPLWSYSNERNQYHYEILRMKGRAKMVQSSYNYYSTPKEATDAGLEYCLTKWILKK